MLRGPDARLRLVYVLLIAALLPILGQLVRLQILDYGKYDEEVANLVYQDYALPDAPAGIIVDRNDDLLVGNMPLYNVGAEIKLITRTVTSTHEAAITLAPLLNVDPNWLEYEVFVVSPEEQEQTIVWRPLANGIGGAAAEALKELREDWYWLTLDSTWRRFYPEGTLASHTLGWVTERGEGYGLEAFQQRFLQPKQAGATGEVDADSSPFGEELAQHELRAYPGIDIQLTLDRTIQAFVEGELDKALLEYGASGGTVLVMNPRTGAVLASASRPHYKPYAILEYLKTDPEIFIDPMVSKAYEPGSVFKVVTVASAVDSGRVSHDWSYYDSGGIEYGGVMIRNSDRQAHGHQGLSGVIAHSLNVGVATLTTQWMGPDVFYQYLRDFGFGRTTGIGLAGEAPGLVNMPTDVNWNDSYLATNSFGQGIAVTPIQLATAVSALANQGKMMSPYIVAERRYPDGRVVTTSPREMGQPVSPETADFVTALMENAIEKTITGAQVPGYRIAGKTGTAQIPVPGGYDPVEVVTSFVGYGPLPDPEILVLVKLERPQIAQHLRWGTQTAAPLFQRIATRLFVLLDIPPTEPISGGVAQGMP
jgi:cell division protein FtsI/penicillin-binding protein 2